MKRYTVVKNKEYYINCDLAGIDYYDSETTNKGIKTGYIPRNENKYKFKSQLKADF